LDPRTGARPHAGLCSLRREDQAGTLNLVRFPDRASTLAGAEADRLRSASRGLRRPSGIRLGQVHRKTPCPECARGDPPEKGTGIPPRPGRTCTARRQITGVEGYVESRLPGAHLRRVFASWPALQGRQLPAAARRPRPIGGAASGTWTRAKRIPARLRLLPAPPTWSTAALPPSRRAPPQSTSASKRLMARPPPPANLG